MLVKQTNITQDRSLAADGTWNADGSSFNTLTASYLSCCDILQTHFNVYIAQGEIASHFSQESQHVYSIFNVLNRLPTL